MSSTAMINSNMAEERPLSPPRSFVRQVMLDTLGNHRSRAGVVWISVLVLLAVFSPFIASSHPYLMKMDGRWTSPILKYLTRTDVLLLIALLAVPILWLVKPLTALQRAGVWVCLVGISILAVFGDVLREPLMLSKSDGSGNSINYLLAFYCLYAIVYFVVAIAVVGYMSISRLGKGILTAFLIGWAALLMVTPIKPPETVIYEQYREWTKEGKIQRAFYAPIPYSASDRLRDQPGMGMQAPSRDHWMGTEVNGADVASRMIHAARIALAIGFIATGIGVIIGVTLGGLMGYYSGAVDLIGMRLVEVFEEIPTLFLLLMFVAVFPRNLYIMMAIIGLTSWTGDARFIRAEFLRLRNQDFVQAAIAAGLPLRSILFRHMLPNGIAPVLVAVSFGVASAILYESTLSFLGLGLVDEPSWGQLLNQALSVGGTFVWWIALFPGLAIFLTVFAYNLIGESMRDALDPRLRGVK